MNLISRILFSTFIQSWWVIAFLLICGIAYEQGLKGREEAFRQLASQQLHLTKEKEKALEIQENLKQQINSQSDPSYIEITLMKRLGVSPEDQQKVYFTN